MRAEEFELGKKFIHKESGKILEVVMVETEEGGEQAFELEDVGFYDWVDENLYEEGRVDEN